MTQITKNFRLGFGSFIDKKVMPFVGGWREGDYLWGCLDPRKEKQVRVMGVGDNKHPLRSNKHPPIHAFPRTRPAPKDAPPPTGSAIR